MGIGSYLIEILEKIAKDNQYKGFCATVLRENQPMVRVFKNRFPDARITSGGGSDLRIEMDFNRSG
jgi:hypothetical protein